MYPPDNLINIKGPSDFLEAFEKTVNGSEFPSPLIAAGSSNKPGQTEELMLSFEKRTSYQKAHRRTEKILDDFAEENNMVAERQRVELHLGPDV